MLRTHSVHFLIAIVLGFPPFLDCAGLICHAQQVDQPSSPDALQMQPEQLSGTIKCRVDYARGMLIAVGPSGAAAIRFRDSFERENSTGNGIIGVQYDFRFLNRDQDSEEQKGSGRLFAKLVDGKIQHGRLSIDIDSLVIRWEPDDRMHGFVGYSPSQFAIHPVSSTYFDSRPPARAKPVDLKRFLIPDPENEAEHRTESYGGQDSDTRRYKQDCAGPVLYGSTAVVVSPTGIATFEFGEYFRRTPTEEVRLSGVPYRFSYSSHDGKTTIKGDDEVYERYTNGKYDGGRLHLQAGPVHVNWSNGGQALGWLYFDPTWERVWQVSEESAGHLLRTLSAANPPTLSWLPLSE